MLSEKSYILNFMSKGIIKGISGDSYVLTGKGYRKAESIELGDIVYSSELKPVKVISISNKIGTGYTFHGSSTIDFTISGDSIIFCFDKTSGNKNWNTVENSFLGMKDSFNIGVPVIEDVEPFTWNGVQFFDGYQMKSRCNLDPDNPVLWYIVGNYVRSGSLRKNKNTLYGKKFEGALVSYPDGPAYSFAKTVCPKTLNPFTAFKSGKQIHVFYSGIEIADFLLQFGEKTRGRLLPPSILALTPVALRAFISGYRRVEWSEIDEIPKESFRIISVNSSLILLLLHIIEKAYGTVPLVHTTKNNAPRNFGDRVVEMNDYHNLEVRTVPGGSRSFVKEGIAWYPIRKITKVDNIKLIEFILSEDAGLMVSHAMVR